MSDSAGRLRQQVLRRVRYATNTLALMDNRLPPEGPFDAALTNGLLAIVAEEWPGEEFIPGHTERLRSASALLNIVEEKGSLSVLVDHVVLQDGLDLTQPARHGRADDEFATINQRHVQALAALDDHPALSFVDTARGLSVDQCVLRAYRDRIEDELPFDPKDRLDTPEPEQCDACWRLTFLPRGWDLFGGTFTAGICIACGYERSEQEAYEEAVMDHLRGLADD